MTSPGTRAWWMVSLGRVVFAKERMSREWGPFPNSGAGAPGCVGGGGLSRERTLVWGPPAPHPHPGQSLKGRSLASSWEEAGLTEAPAAAASLSPGRPA